jgi:hypothetical protein
MKVWSEKYQRDIEIHGVRIYQTLRRENFIPRYYSEEAKQRAEIKGQLVCAGFDAREMQLKINELRAKSDMEYLNLTKQCHAQFPDQIESGFRIGVPLYLIYSFPL